MPETAINKHRDTCRGKHEVGSSSQSLVTTPSGYAVLPKELQQGELSVPVAVAVNPSHDLRSLCLREDVSHALRFGGKATPHCLIEDLHTLNRLFGGRWLLVVGKPPETEREAALPRFQIPSLLGPS